MANDRYANCHHYNSTRNHRCSFLCLQVSVKELETSLEVLL